VPADSSAVLFTPVAIFAELENFFSMRTIKRLHEIILPFTNDSALLIRNFPRMRNVTQFYANFFGFYFWCGFYFRPSAQGEGLLA